MGWDFSGIKGNKFSTDFGQPSDPGAYTGPDAVTPIDYPAPVSPPAPNWWDQIKAGDIKGLTNGITPGGLLNDLGQGLAHGLSQTGSAKQNFDLSTMLTRNTLPGMADIGKKELAINQTNQDYLNAHPVNSIAGQIGEQIPQIPLWMAGDGVVKGIGAGLGKLAPSLIPMAEKVGSKLPGFIKSGLMQGAAYGTTVAPIDNLNEGGNLQSLLQKEKQVPAIALGGAALGGAGELLGKGVSKLGNPFTDHLGPITQPLNEAVSNAYKGIGNGVRPRDNPLSRPTEVPAQLPTQVPIPDPINRDILNRFQTRPDARTTQGTPIPNEVPNTSVIPDSAPTPTAEIPRATVPQQPNIADPTLKERQFAQNVRDSSIAPQDVKTNLDENKLTYEPITNKVTFDKARADVATDPIKAQAQFDAPSKGISADDVALGEALITKAIKEGDSAGANKLIADLAEKLTTAGQAVQAASIFKKLTPEGMLLYANRVVNSTNKDLFAKLGAKANKIEITPEDSEFILETMQRAQTLADGREKDVAIAQVMKLISEKVPASNSEKIKALQRISLLLNPKTMIRNVVGNTVFGAVDNVANAVATPIDMLTSKLLRSNRTTAMPSPLGQLKSMVKGVKLTAADAKLGIDTYHTKTQYEFSGKKIFNNDPLATGTTSSLKTFRNNVLNKLDRSTLVGLKMGDTPFHLAAYEDSIRQQLKLSNVTKPTQKMMDQAQNVADQRTYQDTNALTRGFKLAQQALNGGKELGLGNIVLPFVKTPANILKRAVEYSPIGITDAIREATGKGAFNQKKFVDSISRSVTGTALIMVGYDLAKKGIITGSANKDADIASFERGLGKNDYAFKVGDKLYTYDYLQPASMALAIGADVFIKGKDRKQAENVVVDAIKSGGETLYKQSVLKGITGFMSGYSPMDSLSKTLANAPTQLLPTLGKQISQVMDPNQHSTQDTTQLGTAKNLLKARIPGLTNSLEPKINTSGQTMQNFQGNNSLFNIFVNPGSSTTYQPNAVQKEILRIYDTTGDKSIFPNIAPKSFTVKGESIKLTPQELTKFQQTMGQQTEYAMGRSMDTQKSNANFNQAENDQKTAKLLANDIKNAYDNAKAELIKNRGIK